MADRGLALLGHSTSELVNQRYSVVYDNPYAPATMLPDWIKTEEPSDVSRVTNLDPLYSQWSVFTNEVVHTVNGFAINNHNIVSGDWRVIAYTNANYQLGRFVYESLGPNSIAASANYTGAVTNIDEAISSPDGLYGEPVSKLMGWTARYNFATPTPTPNVATNCGCFVLRARMAYLGAGATSPNTVPKITVKLYESGVLVANLGYRPVTDTSTNGQVLVFPFTFGSLSAPSGVNLECYIAGDPGLSVTDGSYVQIETLRLYYEIPNALIPFPPEDTGWIPFTETTGDVPTRSNHWFLDEDWIDIVDVVLLVRTDQVTRSAPTGGGGIPYSAVNLVPDDFVELGVFRAGETLFLSTAIPEGSTVPGSRINISSLGDVGLIGQTYAVDLFRQRALEGLTLNVTRAELLILQSIRWEKGGGGAFYVALEPDIDEIYQKFTSFWATMSDLGEPVEFGGYDPSGQQMYTLTISFVEKL